MNLIDCRERLLAPSNEKVINSRHFVRGKRSCGKKNRTIVLAMKLTFILLTATFLQVGATGFAQKNFTYSGKKVKLETIFKAIEKQTGFAFFYNIGDLVNTNSVSVQFKDTPLDEVLTIVFKDQPLIFSINGKTIVISARSKESEVINPLVDTSSIFQPSPINVHGRVTNEAGEPLPGVSVIVKGTKKGAVTDANGEFTINNVDGQSTLVFTGVNIETAEVKLNSRSEIGLIAKTKVSKLDEVIVNKGYYTTTKELNTGSVSVVTASTMQKQPVSDPLLALAGRVPGLQIGQGNGALGRSVSVTIGGRNSIRGGEAPLFIVDGIPMFNDPISRNADGASGQGFSLYNSINLGDIESITVLKDADATAIYGSRGANGVILITTRSGQSGRPKVDIKLSQGVSWISSKLKLMNADQYLEMRKEAYQNDGVSPIPSDAYDLTGDWTNRVDWQKLLVGNTAKYTDAQVSYSGGNEYTKYFFNLGYHRETTYMPGDFFSNRVSGQTRIQHSSADRRLLLNMSMQLSKNNNFQPTQTPTFAVRTAPLTPSLYNPDGSLNWENGTFQNPLAFFKQTSNELVYFANSSIGLSYRVADNLTIGTNVAFNYNQISETDLYPLTSLNPAYSPQASSKRNYNSVSSYNLNPKISYKKEFGHHILNVDLGSTIFSQLNTGDGIEGIGYTSDDLLENFSAATTKNFFNTIYSKYKYLSSYARIGYNYKEKYIVNLTGNRDGSTRYGEDKKFANFGAIGAAWILSKENWFQSTVPFISFGKLHANYGITGNDAIGNYNYLDIYSSGTDPYLGLSTLIPARLNNPDYEWEKIAKMEIGLDLGMFNNRINASVNYYSSRTSNQLLPYALPSTAGFTSIIKNIPAIIENKNWEFQLQTTNIKSRNFEWNTSINLTIPKNILVDYPGLTGSSYANTLIIGQSVNISKVLHVLGVNPQTGLYDIQDVNGDGRISYPQDYQSVINLDQKYYGGMNNHVSFKNFELDIFLQFVNRPYQYNYRNNFDIPGSFSNQPTYVLDRWKKAGDNTSVQVAGFNSSKSRPYSRATFSGDYRYSDGSFIRFKNIYFAYNFPKSFTDKVKVNSLRLTCSAQNIWTITKFQGYDPETNSNTPLSRTITFGMNVGF